MGLGGAHGSHGGYLESRAKVCGHQKVLVLAEVVEPALETGIAPGIVFRRIHEVVGVGFDNFL